MFDVMNSHIASDPGVRDLLARSNRLGADPRVTNFAGGNTSTKLTVDDPVTGRPTRVLAVKGSGGDLGTLTAAGLAYLDLDRVLALEAVHARGVHEDDIVDLYASCHFGPPMSAPSIDTPLHAFVELAHVDHLHPDSVIALATAADGEALVSTCYRGRVGWLDWKRPGLELALQIRDLRLRQPALVGVVLGGHGMMCWAPTSDECEQVSLRLIHEAAEFVGAAARLNRVTTPIAVNGDDVHSRRQGAARLAPRLRGVASRDHRMVGHYTDAPVVLDFLARPDAERLASLGTSCPDHFLRTKVWPLWLANHDPVAIAAAHQRYRSEYTSYFRAHADGRSPAMRGADPAIVLVPGIGMFSYGTDPQAARVAGEFYVNAINVITGAETVSTYAPISDAEKFAVEYWELEQRKLDRRPPAPELQGRVAFVTGGGSGIGRAIAKHLADLGACVVIADINTDAVEKVAAELGADRALGLTVDVSDEDAVDAAFADAALRFGSVDLAVNNAGFATAGALVDTSVADWDRLHGVLARGSFLVSRAAARAMAEHGTLGGDLAGDIVYVVSKNSVVAGAENLAYSAAKADQAHQVRLLAAELGPVGIRVNAVNPDGVVHGSGIFAGEWLEQRADAHGVAPEQLGAFYASRTLLSREVLPEHVAEAVGVLVGARLGRTTGLTIPVDGGIAQAFLR